MALVDQLAAVLGDLAVGERAADRPAAAADPVRSLVDLGDVAGLLEPVRAGQAGQAGADDDDPRRRRGVPRTAHASIHTRRREPRAPGEEAPPRQPIRALPTTSSVEIPRATGSETTDAASPKRVASGVRAIPLPFPRSSTGLHDQRATASEKWSKSTLETTEECRCPKPFSPADPGTDREACFEPVEVEDDRLVVESVAYVRGRDGLKLRPEAPG